VHWWIHSCTGRAPLGEDIRYGADPRAVHDHEPEVDRLHPRPVLRLRHLILICIRLQIEIKDSIGGRARQLRGNFGQAEGDG
jgi:hypothetical protein